jgi:hypothetical protein
MKVLGLGTENPIFFNEVLKMIFSENKIFGPQFVVKFCELHLFNSEFLRNVKELYGN